MLDSVNPYRRLGGLIPLRLRLEDESMMGKRDPDVVPAKVTEGPEI